MTQPPTLIQNRYRIERLLGTGGFARVYLGHDERLGRPVAIKELSTSRLDDEEQKTALALFEREARMLAQLDHPGLTNIWDYFDEDGRAYLVMEYVPGPTLRELVANNGGPLPEPLVIACGLRLCDVLSYLHQRNPPVVFRDLKPGNVIVDDLPDGMVATVANLTPSTLSLKLIDFGIARLFKPEQSLDTMIVGTPGYASPEQYGQNQTDARSDVYSLGATLHHLAGGEPPNGLILPPLLEVNPSASPALARIIARATALKPAERYQTIDDMRRDLNAISDQVRTVVNPALSPRRTIPLAPQTIPAPARATAPSPIILAIVALAILGVIGFGAFAASAIGRGTETQPQPTNAPTIVPTRAPVSTLLPGATGQIVYGQCSNSVFACDIYTFDVAFESRRPLVGGANNTSAVLSPNGKLVAVAKSGIIYTGPLENPAGRQISTTGQSARYPAFSPDGSQLAWTESLGNSVYRLVITNLETGATTVVGPERLGWITWGKAGIAYAASEAAGQAQDIFVIGDDGTPRNLTNTPDVEEDFPSWSPDSQQLVFTASRPGNLDTRQIWRMNADGTNRTQLTQNAGPHTNAAFSPDGNWIAYTSRAGGGRFQIWAMRADGSEPRQLLPSNESQFYVVWTP